MKFIIYICDRIRQGRFPRIDCFSFSEKHGLYIYEGRELSASEFNEASKVVFDPSFRGKSFSFAPMAIVPQIVAFNFVMVDRAIMLDGKRVGGLFGADNQLRVVTDFADHRPSIEAWLLSNPQPTRLL